MLCPSCEREIPDEAPACPDCGREIPLRSWVEPAKKTLAWQVVAGVVGLSGLLAIAWGISRLTFKSTPQTALRTAAASQPVSVKLVTGEAIVRPGNYFPVRFKVDAQRMSEARVVGSFEASGGPSNDIEAVLAEESQFENWLSGRQAQLLTSTGRVTKGNLDVPIAQAGTYILAFDNRFSPEADKQVTAEIELRFLPRR